MNGDPKLFHLYLVPVGKGNVILLELRSSSGKEIAAKDLMFEGNEFEKFLDEVEQAKATRYIVLLLRPGSAVFQRKLRKVIRERGIVVGFEPWEAGREIMVAGAGPASAEAEAGSGEAAAEPVPAEPTAPVEGETSAAEGI